MFEFAPSIFIYLPEPFFQIHSFISWSSRSPMSFFLSHYLGVWAHQIDCISFGCSFGILQLFDFAPSLFYLFTWTLFSDSFFDFVISSIIDAISFISSFLSESSSDRFYFYWWIFWLILSISFNSLYIYLNFFLMDPVVFLDQWLQGLIWHQLLMLKPTLSHRVPAHPSPEQLLDDPSLACCPSLDKNNRVN